MTKPKLYALPMVLFAAILIFLAAPTSDANAQGRFVLEKVFTGTKNMNVPANWNSNGNVYEVGFSIRYDSDRCIGTYRVQFIFDRDIRTLRDGEEFSIRIRKLIGRPPCGHKWTSANILTPSNLARLKDYPQFPASYEYNGNIRALRDGRVTMWDGGTVEAAIVLKAEARKNIPFTAFALNVGHSGSFSRMFFLYRYAKVGGARDDVHSANGLERGIDRPGSDFRNFDQARPDPGICQTACAGDLRCKAWTWVRQGYQGPRSRCWLKHSVPTAQRSDCCVSGVKLIKR